MLFASRVCIETFVTGGEQVIQVVAPPLDGALYNVEQLNPSPMYIDTQQIRSLGHVSNQYIDIANYLLLLKDAMIHDDFSAIVKSVGSFMQGAKEAKHFYKRL